MTTITSFRHSGLVSVLKLSRSINFYSGLNSETGIIDEINHPEQGASIVNKLLILPGLSGASGAPKLVEACRLGKGPRAIVLPDPDPVIFTASFIVQELYNVNMQIFSLTKTLATLKTGDAVQMRTISEVILNG